MVIGVSKLNANVYMGDLKDFISILKGMGGEKPGSQGKLSIAEVVQLIGQ